MIAVARARLAAPAEAAPASAGAAARRATALGASRLKKRVSWLMNGRSKASECVAWVRASGAALMVAPIEGATDASAVNVVSRPTAS